MAKIRSVNCLFRWYKDPIKNYDNINSGLLWSTTIEGSTYWKEICTNPHDKNIPQAKIKVKKMLFDYWTRDMP